MAASLRSRRAIPRLAAYTPAPATRRTFLRTTSQPPGVCILCQLYPSRAATQQPRRSFTSTPYTPNHNNSPTSEPLNNDSNTSSSHSTVNGAPDTTNHYTIFPQTLPSGPPPASPFAIPPSDLRREFLQLQNLIHPDKYPSGPRKQHAEALSARINEAYRTILDPLRRAQYLLRELHGIDVTAEDGASHHPLDPELLMEVMDVQEMIEEVGAEPDAEARIAELKTENDTRIAECVGRLGRAFDAGDIEVARHECVRLKFWYSVGDGLREWEPGATQIRLVH
ncbi:hypothetical protein ARAM_005203 [Aspergillus rambellii]|uniref:J domain-containing protein n=1 Tax=Aspergillus rambellii TaxID=308745 RepID=A0A0F8WG31_9EURO|nr:hypothetical protein ARAM_005203 [Aspergillus rambellii]